MRKRITRWKRKHVQTRAKQKGFSLMELLIVIFILSILFSIIFQRMAGVTEKAQMARARAELNQLAKATRMLQIQNAYDTVR